jgi:cysteinyl-tRNA synthetase
MINDDLNTPKALAVMHEMLRQPLSAIEKLRLITQFDSVLGLSLATPMQHYPQNEQNIMGKFKEYKESRANKQFMQSDALRKEIEELGYSIRDTENGSELISVKKFF